METVADMERLLGRLRGMKEPELRLKMNRVEFLRDQARLLDERCRKLENQKYDIKDKVKKLGQVADLIYMYTLAMSTDGEAFRLNVARLGAVSQLMVDMTLAMEKAWV